VLVAAGADCGIALAPASDKPLGAGDSVMLFVRAQVHRYWAEAARTFVLGPAPAPLREMAGRAQDALEAMRRAAQPGASAASVFQAGDHALADDVLRAGARRYGYGGGIGLDAEEAPVLDVQETCAIAEHSALALRVISHGAGMGVAAGGVVLAGHGGAQSLVEGPALIEVQ
jgi:Xaa-Pro aminopeptidase